MRCAPFPWAAWAGIALAVGMLGSADAAVHSNTTAEQELLRSAQLWVGKQRTDLARQHVDKLLMLAPDSVWGLAMLGSIALQENQNSEFRRVWERLEVMPAAEEPMRQLQALQRLYQPRAQAELERMRLLAQSGRTQDAADILQKLFPQGPLRLGPFQLEYFQILGNLPGANPEALDAQIHAAYHATEDKEYLYLWLRRQLQRKPVTLPLLKQIQALALQSPDTESMPRTLWRWAIEKLSWDTTAVAARAFLQRYPHDEQMLARLQQADAFTQEQRRLAGLPINVAKRAAENALASGQLEQAQRHAEEILAIQAQDAEGWGLLGRIAFQQGDYGRAHEQFVQASRWSSDRSWRNWAATAQERALLASGKTLLSQGQTAAAREVAQNILLATPGNIEAHVLLAETYTRERQFDVAKRIYQGLMQQRPIAISALRGWVDLLLEQQAWNEAEMVLAQYAQWLSPSDTDAETQLRADILLSRAEALIHSGELRTAREQLNTALEWTPQSPWLRHRLARVHLMQQQPELADRVMDDGVALVPDLPEMRYARALIRNAQNRWNEAVEDLQAVPVQVRTNAMAQLLDVLLVRSHLTAARATQSMSKRAYWLEQARAISLQTSDIEMRAQLAEIWRAEGHMNEALVLWDALAAAHPLPLNMQLQHLEALWQAKSRPTEMEMRLAQVATQAHALLPAQQRSLMELYVQWHGQAIAAMHADHQMDLARAHAHNAFLPLPDHPLHAAARARLLLATEQWQDAADWLEIALEHEPDNFDWLVDAAFAHWESMHKEAARTKAAQANALVAQHAPWRQLALARLWQRLEQPQRAAALLSEIQKHPEVDQHEVVLHQARLARAQGHYPQAAALFESVLQDAAWRQASPDRASSVSDEYTSIAQRAQSWIETSVVRIRKSGTAGISQLSGWEVPTAAWWPTPEWQGMRFLHVDAVTLDAGRLKDWPTTAATGNARYGQLAAFHAAGNPVSALQGPVHAHASGFNVGTGYQSNDLAWDIGLIGVGMPVTRWVGGWSRVLAETNHSTWRWALSRRAVTGSMLSYAGARDPATGKVWGGVVDNAIELRMRHAAGPWSHSATLSTGLVTGKNVATNQRYQVSGNLGRELWTAPGQRIYLGTNLRFTHYRKNMAEYSWGHGGYYSPQRNWSLTLPIAWTGSTSRWSWQLQASGTITHTGQSRSDLYLRPSHFSGLSAAEQSQHYQSQAATGKGWGIGAVIERKLGARFVVGSALRIDRSRDYEPNQLQVYLRYTLQAPKSDAGMPEVRVVQPYSQY